MPENIVFLKYENQKDFKYNYVSLQPQKSI